MIIKKQWLRKCPVYLFIKSLKTYISMPIYSQKQINKVQLLMSERNMDVNDVVEAMDCSVRDAWALIKLAKQQVKIKASNEQVDVRPPAEYSNKRVYDLI